MEQKDYLLREIEKIGIMLKSILNSIFGNTENLALTIETRPQETKEIVLNEVGFDFDRFLTLDETTSKDYISHFKGFNAENLETLAEIFFIIGKNAKSDKKKIFLEKTIELYKLCNLTDKTFSFERENKIDQAKKALSYRQ
ncbi:MAG: hypothetical protein PF484_03280 [Bacteroidales bacterium]|jgi:hypothetical protein|nr:hypothetical protein [Bacteroidales bacterium]